MGIVTSLGSLQGRSVTNCLWSVLKLFLAAPIISSILVECLIVFRY